MSEKQGSTMFLKYCEVIYARVLFKIWERFSEETGISGCCFLEFPTSNPMLSYEGGSSEISETQPLQEVPSRNLKSFIMISDIGQ